MENLANYSESALSLLPPIVAISMAILTRRVLLSLGIGIILGIVMLTNYSFSDSFKYLFEAIKGLFIEDGGINSWNVSILAFLLLLGMITALLTLSGGTKAFTNWAQKKIKNKKYANLLTAFLGIFIFIDDYFNSLAVGAVSRPVADKFKISRAKVAYLLDSTAAPVCVIAPISSWGAYIITIIAGILAANHINDFSALEAFIYIIPMNFYAIFALLMVFAVIFFELNIGQMYKEEKFLENNNFSKNIDLEKSKSLDDEINIKESENGKVRDLLIPIITLMIATIGFMIFTGFKVLKADGKDFNIMGAFENTDVGMSLFYAGIISLIVSLFGVFRQKIELIQILKALKSGLKLMFGAVLILCFAWLIGGIIKDMETGKYLSMLVEGNMNPQFLPLILFVLSGIMAFATGTSWGTFGIMLPIAGDLAIATNGVLLLPMLAAVLAGSVFGDHCSPISDTTILSSTGARCKHIDHIITQLPYTIIVAIISAIGYFTLGLTSSLLIAFLVSFIFFVISIFVMKKISDR